MNKKTSSVLAAALLLGLASCSDENPWAGEAGQGAIRLTLTADGNIRKAAPSTKADGEAEGGSDLFEKPSVEDFSIHLTHSDGTFKEYPTLGDFKNVGSFKTGAYTLRAFYGRLEDQGFEKPFMEGVETVNVLEGRTAEVAVHAKVANSLVSVKYTDEFKEYLSDYSTTIQSSGYEPVKFESSETRPAFVAPGEVTVTVSFTNPQGQSVTIQPSSFTARPGVHHVLTYNVSNGSSGDMQLGVMIDDNLEVDEVIIDLTEELFTAPGPEVNPKGFEAGGKIEYLAGDASESQYRFNVISHGGLAGVTMTLASNNGYVPEFGSPIELMEATETQQSQLKALGFDIKGLYRNPDRMAIVDFTNLTKHLAAGEYVLTMQAKDKLTRSCEPVAVTINAVEPTLEATPLGALAGLNMGSVLVEYNGANPKEDITFKAQNRNGMYVDAPVQSVAEATRYRSVESKSYNFSIKLPDTDREKIPVKVYLRGQEKQQIELEVSEPSYTLEADAFAKKALIKVVPEDPDYTVLLTENMKLFVVGDAQTKVTERDGENGLIMLEGLNPETSYTVKGTLLNQLPSGAPSTVFTTEAVADVPNGDFSLHHTTIDSGKILAGGVYTYKAMGITGRYQNRSYIVVDTPDYWDNVNNITCNLNSVVKNTWFMVPSTLEETEGEVKIRTVGYNDGECTIPMGTASTLKYFSPVAPEIDQFKVKAGELSYGTEGNGKTFTSRPSSLTFDYKFDSKNGESAEAKVILYSGGKEIGRGTMAINDASGKANVIVNYGRGVNFFNSKATTIAVVFKSTNASDPYIYIPEGDELNDNSAIAPNTNGSLNQNNWGETLEANSYKSLATGSTLTVSNVKLNY